MVRKEPNRIHCANAHPARRYRSHTRSKQRYASREPGSINLDRFRDADRWSSESTIISTSIKLGSRLVTYRATEAQHRGAEPPAPGRSTGEKRRVRFSISVPARSGAAINGSSAADCVVLYLVFPGVASGQVVTGFRPELEGFRVCLPVWIPGLGLYDPLDGWEVHDELMKVSKLRDNV
jgi:hypothetical protein